MWRSGRWTGLPRIISTKRRDGGDIEGLRDAAKQVNDAREKTTGIDPSLVDKTTEHKPTEDAAHPEFKRDAGVTVREAHQRVMGVKRGTREIGRQVEGMDGDPCAEDGRLAGGPTTLPKGGAK